MATNQTIVTTLMADPKPFSRGIGVAIHDADNFGKAFGRLDAATKRASIGGSLTNDVNRFGGASSNAARGVLELSRGVEDAAVSFGVNGVQGAIRGSLNNISQFAMMMGGPVAGAVAGFAAAGVSIAAPYISSLLEGEDAAERFGKQLDIVREKEKKRFEDRVKEREGAIDFRNELKGMESPDSAKSAIESRNTELEKMQARLEEIGKLREGLFTSDQMPPVAPEKTGEFLALGLAGVGLQAMRGDVDPFVKRFAENADAMRAEVAKNDQLDFQLANERLGLLRKEIEMKVEIGRLQAKDLELKKQQQQTQREKDAEEFAAIIRKFQEEDAREEERKAGEAERKAERDAEQQRDKEIRDTDRAEGMLKGRIVGLGGKFDPLEGMDIPRRFSDGPRKFKFGKDGTTTSDGWKFAPGSDVWEKMPELEDDLRDVLGDIDAFNQKPRAQFAQVATADSQSLLRAQFQAKESAERKKEAAKLQKILEDLLREIRDARKKQDQEKNDEDGVNLN